jgi:predicted nucleotidyltransferase
MKTEISRLFGKDVVSIILYGSAATDEYVPKKSDFNFLVVLSQDGIHRIEDVQKYVSRWKKIEISLPLFLTKSYIEASLDSYPVEFFNMKAAYLVLSGEDILKSLAIRNQDLRLECERELKGKLLQLRQGFILTRSKSVLLKRLMVHSLVAFISIFRVLLYLKNKEIPGTKQDVLLGTCREFHLDEGLFSVLLSLREDVARLTKGQLIETLKRYIFEIEKLVQAVDAMKL